jgi:hypothetical protein
VPPDVVEQILGSCQISVRRKLDRRFVVGRLALYSVENCSFQRLGIMSKRISRHRFGARVAIGAVVGFSVAICTREVLGLTEDDASGSPEGYDAVTADNPISGRAAPPKNPHQQGIVTAVTI